MLWLLFELLLCASFLSVWLLLWLWWGGSLFPRRKLGCTQHSNLATAGSLPCNSKVSPLLKILLWNRSFLGKETFPYSACSPQHCHCCILRGMPRQEGQRHTSKRVALQPAYFRYSRNFLMVLGRNFLVSTSILTKVPPVHELAKVSPCCTLLVRGHACGR